MRRFQGISARTVSAEAGLAAVRGADHAEVKVAKTGQAELLAVPLRSRVVIAGASGPGIQIV